MKKKIIKILGIINLITYIVAFVFSVLSMIYDNEFIDKLWHAFFLTSSVLLIVVSTLRMSEEKLRRYIEEREKQDRIDPFDDFKAGSNTSTDESNNFNNNDEI